MKKPYLEQRNPKRGDTTAVRSWSFTGFLLIFCVLPLFVGWQKVDLKDILTEQRKALGDSQAAVTRQDTPSSLSPLLILEKVSTALFSLKSMEVDTELWLEHDLFHVKSDMKDRIENVDNSQTDGRNSISLIEPFGASTSEWVQTFQISGMPFTWDAQKREWKKEELMISGKDAEAVLAYSFLQSLFQINGGEADSASLKLLGTEKRNGRDCFVLSYDLNADILKRQGVVGKLTKKIWVDSERFFPYTIRAEGRVRGMYFLEIMNFSGFNTAAKVSPPAVISTEVKKEKDKLKARISTLMQDVAGIRGWKPQDDVAVEFVERVSLRKYLDEEVGRMYTAEELAMEDCIFKWLGLIPEYADYRESMINSEISSVAGLYDPRQHKIFVGDWIPAAVADPVLVHEICHAYQDKAVDMREFMSKPEVRANLDTSTARHTLLEGEAEAVMLEYLLSKDGMSFKSLGDIFAFIEEKILKNAGVAPEDIAYNIYAYGANYIQYYLKDNTWKDLDVLWKKPPSTMNQILHPYRHYAAKTFTDSGSKNGAVKELELPQGWQKRYRTNLGEFYLLVSLRKFLPKDEAEQAGSGWNGDAITVYQNKKGEQVIVLQTKWTSSADAQNYVQALKKWLNKRFASIAEEAKAKHTIMRTDKKYIFSYALDNDLVTVVGSRSLGAEEFKSLVDALRTS